MILYFEFEDKRRKAEVTWPKDGDNIVVQVTDRELNGKLPPDLYFDVDKKNKIRYTIENPDEKRLIQLQSVIGKRLQELINH